MNWLIIFIAVAVILVLAMQAYWTLAMHKAQRLLKEQMRHEQPTLWDVRDVLVNGDRDLAVQLYCDIFHIQDIELARREVDELARAITR